MSALTSAIEQVTSGGKSWVDWSGSPERARLAFAGWLGVAADDVALMNSVAEATATVARGIPQGVVVVGANEFRSNLFGWQQLDPSRNPLRLVGQTGTSIDQDALLAAIDAGTALVAVSSVLSFDGQRVDLEKLREATDAVGARLFVDATQSLGVLDCSFDDLRPDYLAVHGYKWMLAPRGAAWLVVRPELQDELHPIAPGWTSNEDHGFFGGQLERGSGVRRLDSSPAWPSWIGAVAALEVLGSTDRTEVEAHCTGLARTFRQRLIDSGIEVVGPDTSSHIALARPRSVVGTAAALTSGRLRATMLGPYLRAGFHYFNNLADVDVAIDALTNHT
jgi:selenocysteine lyase/cysteine desulfurase